MQGFDPPSDLKNNTCVAIKVMHVPYQKDTRAGEHTAAEKHIEGLFRRLKDHLSIESKVIDRLLKNILGQVTMVQKLLGNECSDFFEAVYLSCRITHYPKKCESCNDTPKIS